jgi:outer membrane protein insertion porin family
VALVRGQGGYVTSWGGKDLRILDQFYQGGNLVRGFEPQGFGPRDLASQNLDAIGGSLFWGATAELQFAVWPIPKDVGLRFAIFHDAGSLWSYAGPSVQQLAIQFPGLPFRPSDDSMKVRASVGAGIIWDSPFGPLRIDYGYAYLHEPWCGTAAAFASNSCDKQQSVRFSGGTRF